MKRSSNVILVIGEKFFVAPWKALTLDSDNKCFVLQEEKERFKSAPGFDKDSWPNMADQAWAESIRAYYKT
ncbi:hypothetical protein SAMN05216419_103312 [Nitrosomonas cryotolerans]|uniref:PRC-barrel domain-containing protein n=1 Tax=Nitrosomonas cryotolerans ATCC 49181 TaxID=1131553 RepID=A0A1N6FX81_9PROT|nr:hypothetical protein [Nitrosomonas cryotolerans]SFP91980.1 hypothetical protein SAMN05216419_103312 [Nitrosomonas cryotolerans]SIN99878.1 hypothetical protein SAMN02743940_0446 [Nitrosomonas cryotolerans ATCC 49181]